MSQQLRIIHIITGLDRGGAENQLLMLARAQKMQGHKVSIIPLKGQADLAAEFEALGLQVMKTFMNRTFIIQIVLIARLLYGLQRQIVVHAHLPRAEVLSTIATFLGPIPLVVTKHNAEPCWPERNQFLSLLLSKLIFTRASAIILISEAIKTYLVGISELPKINKKVFVMPYGYNWSHTINSYRSVSLTEVFPHKDEIYLGTISRLVPQKGLDTLIQAVHALNSKYGKPTFLEIIGCGPLGGKLEELSKNLNLQDKVVFHGCSYPKPFEVFNFLDIFVLSSRYEGFGLVLLEAVDNSIPIVATDSSAIPEVLGSNYPFLARLSDPDSFAEKILQLHSLDSLDIINESYKQVRLRFDILNTANRLEEVYRNVILIK